MPMMMMLTKGTYSSLFVLLVYNNTDFILSLEV